MSLCVAWKYEEAENAKIFFAADSCAVVGTQVMPFSGIKVLELPVRIISAIDAQTRQYTELLSTKYGMAFAGSYFTAFLMKELVAEVLTHLQFIGPVESVSFDTICELVLRFHSHFHNRISNQLSTDYELDFFLGGYCPASGKIRVAKFYVNPGTGLPDYKEVLQETGFHYETIGIESGQNRFKELMDLSLVAECRTHLTAFRRLWDVIQDPEIKFVKGAVQYGEFEDTSFKLAGSFEAKNDGERLKQFSYIRGTDIDEIHGSGGFGDLHIQYTFGDPFREDVASFDVSRTFWQVPETVGGAAEVIRRVTDEQITMVPHNSKWAEWFAEERDYLQPILGNDILVEHVGSTAVPGLAGVPIVDIAIGVEAVGDPQTQPFNFSALKYEYLGDKLFPGQLNYRKRHERQFNILIVDKRSQRWKDLLAFRDKLRNEPAFQEMYTRERIAILNSGSWTLIRYICKKNEFIKKSLETINWKPS